MRKIVLFLVVVSGLYSAESCYTVQLLSSLKSPKVKEEITQKKYDSSCEVMEIGRSITVRCGCFEKIKEAKEHLSRFTPKYKNAYIATTYKYRFKKTAPIVVPKVEPKPESKMKPKSQEKLVHDEVLKPQAPAPEKLQVVPSSTLVQEQVPTPIEEKKSKKKKKKKKKKSNIQIVAKWNRKKRSKRTRIKKKSGRKKRKANKTYAQ
jgi:hypothetical protein